VKRLQKACRISRAYTRVNGEFLKLDVLRKVTVVFTSKKSTFQLHVLVLNNNRRRVEANSQLVV
jgi:hypothetical protein